ncbi:hypothetical protein FOXG_17951 [Fusarium oxysporum f. sp. lycopersici 4287]|uniref:Uncharacterized protein n=3 Tax=Fusarium oxysporum TaxID=5507 RepID=W9IIT8_FUSOX|nr:hypothetical protein FOXG_17951 [Fusarium oxysporum f. sp. lycopersici 4287]EWY93230.1 hypothetical protein FOYG_06516 [Fusarium oxysporum NRRL 32931]EXK48749.1 hypothetical protein FOMG_01548 [Fusarium oxysporum f. sp. melonis 26406]KNA95053.1 hypothetical protein FOXG_17951 [Fusarium oxysporum f. sp. lycopersici 4287]
MTQYTFFTNSLTKHVEIHHLLPLHVPLAGARSTFPSLSKRLNPFTDFYNLPLQVVHQASQVAVPPYSVATRSQGPINSLGGSLPAPRIMSLLHPTTIATHEPGELAFTDH